MLEPRPAVLGLKSYRSPSAGLAGLNLNNDPQNTAGCSPRVYRKLASLTAEDVSRYPHRDHCEEIVARFLGVSPDQVVLTNGVDEGLHLVCETYLREEDEATLRRANVRHVRDLYSGDWREDHHCAYARRLLVSDRRDHRAHHSAHAHDRARQSEQS